MKPNKETLIKEFYKECMVGEQYLEVEKKIGKHIEPKCLFGCLIDQFNHLTMEKKLRIIIKEVGVNSKNELIKEYCKGCQKLKNCKECKNCMHEGNYCGDDTIVCSAAPGCTFVDRWVPRKCFDKRFGFEDILKMAIDYNNKNSNRG